MHELYTVHAKNFLLPFLEFATGNGEMDLSLARGRSPERPMTLWTRHQFYYNYIIVSISIESSLIKVLHISPLGIILTTCPASLIIIPILQTRGLKPRDRGLTKTSWSPAQSPSKLFLHLVFQVFVANKSNNGSSKWSLFLNKRAKLRRKKREREREIDSTPNQILLVANLILHRQTFLMIRYTWQAKQ